MTDWATTAAAHREKQSQSIPLEWNLNKEKLLQISGCDTPEKGCLIKSQAAQRSGLLSQTEINITQSQSARDLLRRIHARDFSAEEVIVAFCKRAAIAQQLTSCLTEIFFSEAIERAKWLDEQMEITGKVVGPLHGLPISIKDSFYIEGQYATVGYVAFLKQLPPKDNASLVRLLLDAGAVLYCKTNIPQTMMTADSENNIFGRTLNPHNTRLTAGGSSGGEGALVAFQGSILGVGTDIAGSVRIPALCCGVYGFKPTVNRIPFQGQSLAPFAMDWLSSVLPAAGPLATSADDLSLFMETVINQEPWKYDSSALYLPWRQLEKRGEKKLTIGVFPEDPEYPLHPPVRRALRKAALALEESGHQIVHISANPKRSASLGARIAWQFFGLGSQDPATIAELMGEPFVASVAQGMHPFSKDGLPISPELGIPTQFHQLNIAQGAYAELWKETWQEYQLDVILAPGSVGTAVPHDTYGMPVYTLMWNTLDYAAAIIPYGTASKSMDPTPQKAIAKFVPDYDPEETDGAPCAVQIVTPKFRDEECLEAVGIIDRILNPKE